MNRFTMDAEEKHVNSVLSQLEKFHVKFVKERSSWKLSLNAANARIVELDRELALVQEKNRNLTEIIEKLQSKLECYFEDIDSASAGPPSVKSTEEVDAFNKVIESQKNSIDSENSASSIGKEGTIDQNVSPPLKTNENDDDAVDTRKAAISEENNQVETVSELISNSEIVTKTDGISNYFSNFYIDPQAINNEENLPMIPSSIQMILSSYESFNQRLLVFVTDESSPGSSDCHFLSIDDLLALPENADLVQQLHESRSKATEEGQNLTLCTIVSHLITRARPAIPRYTDRNCESTNEHLLESTEGVQIKTEEETPAVKTKRSRTPTKKKPAPKRKKSTPTFANVEDANFNDVLGDSDSKSKLNCRVCEIENHVFVYFKNRLVLDQHLLESHPLNTFPTYLRCPYGENECTRHFLNQGALRSHIRWNHPDENSSAALQSAPKLKSWSCSYCGDEFLSSRIFLKHMNENHPGFTDMVEFSKAPQLRGHCKVTEAESTSKETKFSNTRKRSIVTDSRMSSLSSLDDDYYPDTDLVSSTTTYGKKARLGCNIEKNSSKPDSANIVVIAADVHQENMQTKQKERSSQKASSNRSDVIDTRQKSQSTLSSSNADPTDINEFVLSSVYEISSLIEKGKIAPTRPSALVDLPSLNSPTEKVYHTMGSPKKTNRSTSSYQSSHYSVAPALPCLLDDCTGCDFHPKKTVINLTLDDEFVSSCRDEILADLYSIPDDPPMVTGWFSAALSSRTEYNSVQADTNGGEKKDVKNDTPVNAKLVNDHDIANIIIAEDQCGETSLNDQINSNHPSLKDNSSQKIPIEDDHRDQITENEITAEDSTTANETLTENAPSIEDDRNGFVADEERSILNDDRLVETDSIENQNETASSFDDNPTLCNTSTSIHKDQFENLDQNRTSSEPNPEESLSVANDISVPREDPVESEMDPDQNKICDDEQTTDVIQGSTNKPSTPITNGISISSENPGEISTDSTLLESEIDPDRNKIHDKEQTADIIEGSTDESTTRIVNEISPSTNPVEVPTESTQAESEIYTNRNKICDDEHRNEQITGVIEESANESPPPIENETSSSSKDPVKITDSTPLDSAMNPDQSKTRDNEDGKIQVAYVDIAEAAEESPASFANEISIPSRDRLIMEEQFPTNLSSPDSEDAVDEIRCSDDGLGTNDAISPALTPPTCENIISNAEDLSKSPQANNENQLPGNLTPETILVISDSDESPIRMIDPVPTSRALFTVKKTYQKSIFDPDNESNPATPIVDCSDSPRNLEIPEFNRSVIAEKETGTLVTSSPLTSPRSHQSNAEITESRTSPANVSCDVENNDANPAEIAAEDSPLNLSTSNVNSIFLDEFGLSSVCEIETLEEKESSEANVPKPVPNQPSSENSEVIARTGSVRFTNEIIEGTYPITESSPILKPLYPQLHQNSEFASIVIFNQQNLGKCSNENVEAIEIEINDSSTSQSSTSEFSSSTNTSVPSVDKEPDPDDRLDDTAPEKSTTEDNVPVVDSTPPQITPILNDNGEKEGFEAETHPSAESSSPHLSQVEKNAQDPLISSSSQEPGVPDNGSNEKIDNENMLDLISRYGLIDVVVMVPRLIIDESRPISASYHLKRQKRVPNFALNLLTSERGKKSKFRRTFHCTVCDEIFLIPSSLRKHVNEVHAGVEGTISCTICGFVALNTSALANHRKSRHNLFFVNVMGCGICQNKLLFDSTEALSMHIVESHPNPYPPYVRCPHGEGECFMYFWKFDDFRDHVEIYHENEDLSISMKNVFPGAMPWQCSLCGKVFLLDEYLSDHLIKDHDQ